MITNWQHIANYGPWRLFAGRSESGSVYCISETDSTRESTGIFFTIAAALASGAIRRPFEGGAHPQFVDRDYKGVKP